MSGPPQRPPPDSAIESNRSAEADDSFADVLRALAATTAPSVAAESILRPGDRVGRYVLRNKIGEGGMGVVYRASDPTLQRTIAIKVHRGFAPRDDGSRLLREAKSMARLTHPNVLNVYEVGEHRGRVFIAMEYAEHGSLRGWLAAKDRPWREVLAAFVAAGRGLAAAHAIGISHRDFKPDNVLLDSRGSPRVADFGLARPLPDKTARAGSGGAERSSSAAVQSTTSRSVASGTPHYMPPEQCQRGDVTAATDQFAFCASLYEALYGHPPFGTTEWAERLEEIEAGRVRPVDTDLPSHIFAALKRGLAARPPNRFESMDALLAALSIDRRRRWLGGVAVLGLLGAGGVLAWLGAGSSDPCAAVRDAVLPAWSDDRRAAVSSALGATGVDQVVATEAVVALDDFAGSWGRDRLDACESTLIDGAQSDAVMDQRMACLDRARAGFEGAARAFESTDEVTSQGVRAIVRGLPKLAECADLDALSRDVAPPAQQEIRDAVAGLRADTEEIMARQRAGVAKGAAAAIDSVLANATEVDYAPLLVEIRYARGRILDEVGRHAEASKDFEAAMLLAIEIGHHPYAALAGPPLAFNLEIHDNRPDEASRVLSMARAMERRRPSARAVLLIEGTESRIAWHQGDMDAAVRSAERALAQAIEVRGDAALAWGERNHYASMLSVAGRLDEAEVELALVIAQIEQHYGPDDARLLHPLRVAGLLRLKRGDRKGLAELLGRRVPIAERAHGVESMVTVNCLRDFAEANITLGQSTRAEALLTRAAELVEALPTPDPIASAEVWSAKASLLNDNGDCPGALAALDRARERFEAALGSDNDRVIRAQNNVIPCIAEVRGGAHAHEVAMQLLHLRERGRVRGAELVPTVINAAGTARRAGKHDAAVELATRGLALLAAEGTAEGTLFEILSLVRGRCLRALGRTEEAEADFVAADASTRQQTNDTRKDAESARTLAVELWAYPEHREAARAAAARALMITKGHDEPWAGSLTEDVEAWLVAHPRP